MKRKRYLFFAVVFVACLLFIPDCKIVHASASVEDYGAHMEEYEITTTEQALKRYQQKEVYRIDSCSVPLKKSGFSKYSTYNKYTKNYYTIRSYMAEFEKKGGGTLILEAGTYELCTAIYIPNNVTLILEDGVNILKTTKTGTKKVKSSESLFQLVTAKKAKKKASVKKYKGVKNVNIIGIGTAIMDLDYRSKHIAIICGHNKNIRISGITFQNMNKGHFIEVDACDGVVIEHCRFSGVKEKSDYTKEAINLDTPDKKTKGFNSKWSALDLTPNKNVMIENCSFSQLGRAIGTHKYSVKKKKQVKHTNITITNNVITDMYNDGAIRVINWKNSTISNNTIIGVVHAKNLSKTDTRGILLSGTDNVTVTRNYISNVGRAFQYMAWKNSGAGSKYAVTKDKLTQDNKTALGDNWVTELYEGEYYTRVTYKYKKYSNAEIIPITVDFPEVSEGDGEDIVMEEEKNNI